MKKPTKIMVSLICWLIGLAWLIPAMGVLMASFRPFPEIMWGWWIFEEFNPTLENYISAWTNPTVPLSRGMLNSLLVVIPSTVLPLAVATLAAYGFARFKFRFKDHLFVIVTLLMTLPIQMIAISVYKMYFRLGLLDTHVSLILLHSAMGMIWLMFFFRGFFQTLPVETEEAARMDGASHFAIFYKIVLPLSIPALISAGILQFVWVWNDFFLAIITLFDTANFVITQNVAFLKGHYFIDLSLLSASSVIAMLIPLLIFVPLQKYFIRGVIGWGIKG